MNKMTSPRIQAFSTMPLPKLISANCPKVTRRAWVRPLTHGILIPCQWGVLACFQRSVYVVYEQAFNTLKRQIFSAKGTQANTTQAATSYSCCKIVASINSIVTAKQHQLPRSTQTIIDLRLRANAIMVAINMTHKGNSVTRLI